jgi:hypothetical protein
LISYNSIRFGPIVVLQVQAKLKTSKITTHENTPKTVFIYPDQEWPDDENAVQDPQASGAAGEH